MILDASALLALIQREAGYEHVLSALPRARMSTVNLSEVLSKQTAGHRAQPLEDWLEELGIAVDDFTREDARTAAELVGATRKYGLSLGDRACLALARRTALPVLTADRAWKRLDVGIDVRVIR